MGELVCVVPVLTYKLSFLGHFIGSVGAFHCYIVSAVLENVFYNLTCETQAHRAEFPTLNFIFSFIQLCPVLRHKFSIYL